MFKSSFAKEFSKSSEALNNDIELNDRMEIADGEVNNWFSHEKFKEILDKKEQTIFKASYQQKSRFSSPRSSVASHISNFQSMIPAQSSVSLDKDFSGIKNRKEMERLEAENLKLRQQLEMFSKGDVMESKYANLASEVVRLQDSVSQMEQSKAFYENSTRQLVNILECLSTQLTSNNSCQTRHCSSASHENHDNIDSDSFDSLLSRQSYEQSQSSIASQRPSLDSYKQSEDVEVTSPIYENVYYKNPIKGPTIEQLPEKMEPISEANTPTFKEPNCGNLEPSLSSSTSKLSRRCDSLSSVLSAQSKTVPAPPRVLPRQRQNRILMGSSSVRRVMSQRGGKDHAKSFSALGKLDMADSEAFASVGQMEQEVEDAFEANEEQRRYSYSRSKSVASGLPHLVNISQTSQQDSTLDGVYDSTKSLLRKRKDKEDSPHGKFGKLLKQMKNIVGKDKNKRTRSSDLESQSGRGPSLLGSKLRHQSTTCLTPRSLRQATHHSTPRLIKH